MVFIILEIVQHKTWYNLVLHVNFDKFNKITYSNAF